MQQLKDLTIVVPTRNEAANIGAFLASIPPEAALIVVDRSIDDTRAIVRRQRPLHTTVIECDGSLTVARQTGAIAARTRWLLFTDADIAFAADYFAHLAGLLGGTTASSPAMLIGPKLSAGEYPGHYRRLAVVQRVLAGLGIPAASGSNMLVTAEAFAAVGGFDTDLSCNEDSELAWRIARAGFAWRLDRTLVALATDHRRLKRGALRKTLHTVFRCSTLYLGVVPRRWRSHDWGYWRERRLAE